MMLGCESSLGGSIVQTGVLSRIEVDAANKGWKLFFAGSYGQVQYLRCSCVWPMGDIVVARRSVGSLRVLVRFRDPGPK